MRQPYVIPMALIVIYKYTIYYTYILHKTIAIYRHSAARTPPTRTIQDPLWDLAGLIRQPAATLLALSTRVTPKGWFSRSPSLRDPWATSELEAVRSASLLLAPCCGLEPLSLKLYFELQNVARSASLLPAPCCGSDSVAFIVPAEQAAAT